MQIRICHFKCG